MGRLRRFAVDSGGAAAIEFALLSPLFLILLAGMLNLGSQAFVQSRVNQAIRETAEAALFTQDKPALLSVLRAALADIGVAAGSAGYLAEVRLLCLCPGSADLPDCTPAQAARCSATGLPWEVVVEVEARTLYRPLLPMPGFADQTLSGQLRVQVR